MKEEAFSHSVVSEVKKGQNTRYALLLSKIAALALDRSAMTGEIAEMITDISFKLRNAFGFYSTSD